MSPISSYYLLNKDNLSYKMLLKMVLSKNNKLKFRNTLNNNRSTPINSNKDSERTPIQSFHLLLIEDNPIASRLVEIIIRKMGHQLTSTRGGESAIRLIKQTSFDIILTNIRLPGISGVEVCQQIRALEDSQQLKEVPIIGLATHITDKEKQACLQVGMNGVFIKPLNLKVIQDIITQFLTKSREHEKQISLLTNSKQPQSELQLLKLRSFPLLDPIVGMNNTGSEILLKELLTMLLNQELDTEKVSIEDAYNNQNQKNIIALAHKMRSSAIYCGAIRLHTACQYIELYLNIGNQQLFDKLCMQLLNVIDETKLAISNYLAK